MLNKYQYGFHVLSFVFNWFGRFLYVYVGKWPTHRYYIKFLLFNGYVGVSVREREKERQEKKQFSKKLSCIPIDYDYERWWRRTTRGEKKLKNLIDERENK